MDRIYLKPLTENDANLIFSLRSNEAVIKYTGIKKHTSVDNAISYIRKILDSSAKDECVMWTINLSENNDPIGTVCLWNYSDDRKSAEIGYDLLPEFWGKGLALEAVNQVVYKGFNDFGFLEIHGDPEAAHKASQRVLQKAGFELLSNGERDGTAFVKFSIKKQ